MRVTGSRTRSPPNELRLARAGRPLPLAVGPPALLLLAVLAISGCGEPAPDAAEGDGAPGGTEPPTFQGRVQGVSLLGDTLRTPALPPDVLADRLARLAEARAAHDAAPDDPDAIIWLGRRLAYLGAYRRAIEVFTEGIRKHPEDARMYRHRGHRHITTRRLDRAVEDLERAARLIEGTEDRVEPDGLPNERGIPTSTLHSNIWYHLGLARYLRGDLEGALAAYRRCLDVSANPDMLVATSNWLYMTLRRLGRDDEAARVLELITADLDVIENDSYHRLLLLYRGELGPAALREAEGDALGNATVGYGIGNWHLYEGRAEEAARVFREVLATDSWAAFGYIAAEAELARGTVERTMR